MGKKKINPRKKPATQMDIKRAKSKSQDEALYLSMAIFLTVLVDKEGYNNERLKKVWAEVNNLSDSISKGYVKFNDLRQVLDDEYDIVI